MERRESTKSAKRKSTGRKWSIWARIISIVLTVSLIAPQTCQLAAYAAEAVSNMPRQVDFDRPEGMTLEDIGIASGSDAEDPTKPTEETKPAESIEETKPAESTAETKPAASTTGNKKPLAETEEKEIREPEVFYEEYVDEPEGKLVRFSDTIRTYELEEGKYLSIMGGYSGLYRDEDGEIRPIDNTLVNAEGSTAGSVEEESEAEPNGTAVASASNARRAKSARRKTAQTYTNESGAMDVRLPEKITSSKGVTIEKDGYQIEMIPSDGDFSDSVVSGNAIRYSNVFENVDVQYSLVGNSVKEDIILLEKGTRTTFSYRLKTDGLKVKQTQNSLLLYKESAETPVFTLTAPIMRDAEEEIGLGLTMSAVKKDGDYLVTLEADKGWLLDKERVYPVRIDPSINSGPEGFKVVSVSSANPGTNYLWTKPAYVGYDDGSKTGNTPSYGNTRAYFALGRADDGWNQVPRDMVIDSATFSIGQQSDWSGGVSRFVFEAPDKAWNIGMTWNEQQNLTFTPVGEAVSAVGKDQMYQVDVTEIMKQWLAGTKAQYGLSMRAEVEPPSEHAAQEFHHVCELLYNQDNPTYGPRLQWVWGGELPPEQPDLMDINDLEVYLNPITVPGEQTGSRITEGVLTYGLSQVGSKVTYTLKEEESGETAGQGEKEAEEEKNIRIILWKDSIPLHSTTKSKTITGRVIRQFLEQTWSWIPCTIMKSRQRDRALSRIRKQGSHS